MTGWPTIALGEVAVLRKGVSYSSQELGLPGPYLVGLGQFSRTPGDLGELRTYGGGFEEHQTAAPGETLIALTDITQDGSVLGALLIVPDSVGPRVVFTLDTAKVEVVNPLVDPTFLVWSLRSPQFRRFAFGFSTGTTVRRISATDAGRYEIALPPLTTQRSIAAVLDAFDRKIELNRRMSETLEAMARALFKSWFVDFDPVRAKSEGRDPGLPKPLADLFPDSFEDSTLGEFPKGWEKGTFGDVAEHPRRTVRPGEIGPQTPYIALEHMPMRTIALADWGLGDGLASTKFEFRRGEFLFGKLRPYFHKVGVAPVDGVCSTDIVVIRPKAEAWFGFVLGHASSVEFVNYTNAGSTGTKMPRTSWTEMARYEVALPPVPVADAFSERVRPAIERIADAIHESRTLAALRDSLLPRLISGELRVRDVAAAGGESA